MQQDSDQVERAGAAVEEHTPSAFPNFLHHIPGVIGVFDGPDHVCVFVNDGYAALMEHADIVGKPARTTLLGIQTPGIIRIFDRVYAAGQPLLIHEVAAPYADKRSGPGEALLDFTIMPVRDAAGNVTGVMVHAVDVTEQVQVRKRLERVAAEQAAVFMYMADGVIIVDPGGKVTFANDAARALLGLDPSLLQLEGVLARVKATSLETEFAAPSPAPLTGLLTHESEPRTASWQIQAPEGEERVLQATFASLGSGSRRLGTVMVLRDTTEQRELENQKSAFLSSIAHDLRTPLTTIRGRVQMLMRRSERVEQVPSDVVRRDLERVHMNIRRLGTLIDELLDVANASLGRSLQLNPKPTDLIALTRDTAADFEQTVVGHTIELSTEEAEVIGQWDAQRLQRVLSNLLSNAVKYSPSGGAIYVDVGFDPVADEAVLTVRDEGVGIPAPDLPHIFDRFHRGKNVHAIPGTGIGLTTVYDAVRQHGGTLSVDSREGQGAAFTIRLPRQPESASNSDLENAKHR